VTMTSVARWSGLLVGVSLALVSLVQARVPAGTGEVPAHVSLIAERSVRLGVDPVARELLSERLIVPGTQSVSGLVEISNFTTGALEVEPRLSVIRGELPDGLRVRVTAGGRTLYAGAAAGLDADLRLRARAKQPLRFRFSAPAHAAGEVQGRSMDLRLRFATRKAGR
jgi:hypothetical protein